MSSIPLKQRLVNLGFREITLLGKGNFGEVRLYQYEGHEPEILGLCDSRGWVAIKLSDPPDRHEASIASYFDQLLMDNPGLGSSHINRISPLKDGDGLLGILTQYGSYIDTLPGENTPVETSSNLENFLKNTFHPHYAHQATGAHIQSAFKEDIGIFMGQIASNMVLAQNQLHQQSLLHLDTATRNFLVSTRVDSEGNLIGINTKISDYGLSSVVGPGENYGKYPGSSKVPLRWVDWNTLTTKIPSIQTDLFARKASIIGMLGLTLKKCNAEAEFLSLTPPDSDPNNISFEDHHDHIKNRVKDASDQKALEKYLDYVKHLVNQCSDPEKKGELTRFIDAYESYLLSMPKTFDFKLAAQGDADLFMDANNRFARSTYNHLLSINPDSERLKKGLERLQEIPITDAQLALQINTQLIQLKKNLGSEDPSFAAVTPLVLRDPVLSKELKVEEESATHYRPVINLGSYAPLIGEKPKVSGDNNKQESSYAALIGKKPHSDKPLTDNQQSSQTTPWKSALPKKYRESDKASPDNQQSSQITPWKSALPRKYKEKENSASNPEDNKIKNPGARLLEKLKKAQRIIPNPDIKGVKQVAETLVSDIKKQLKNLREKFHGSKQSEDTEGKENDQSSTPKK